MRIFYAAVIMACFAAGTTLQALADKVLLDGVAARINNRMITIGEVLTVMYPLQKKLSGSLPDAEYRSKMKEAYKEALDSLIDRHVILDSDAAKKIAIPEWFLNRRADAIIRESFGGDKAKLMEVLTADRQTYEGWREELSRHITVATVRSMEVDDKVRIDPASVRAVYDGNPNGFVSKPQVKIRMIVLSAENDGDLRKKQADVQAKIGEGVDFAEIAVKFSSGVHAAEGGDWGWIEPEILNKQLQDVIAGMKEGALSDPLRLKDEVYILKMEGRRDARRKSFEEVATSIEQELRKEKTEEAYKEWISRLRAGCHISVSSSNPFE